MYAMIHSAEIVHHQHTAELARDLERARIRKDQEVEAPAKAHISLRARLVAAFQRGHAAVPSAGPIASAH